MSTKANKIVPNFICIFFSLKIFYTRCQHWIWIQVCKYWSSSTNIIIIISIYFSLLFIHHFIETYTFQFGIQFNFIIMMIKSGQWTWRETRCFAKLNQNVDNKAQVYYVGKTIKKVIAKISWWMISSSMPFFTSVQ